jgi:hypothetical protein
MTPLPSVPVPTSEAAAEHYQPRAQSARERVLAIIRAAGPHGRTDDEIELLTGLRSNTCRPRRWELAGNDGKPARIAQHGTRPTRSGERAAVWVACEYLRGQLELCK